MNTLQRLSKVWLTLSLVAVSMASLAGGDVDKGKSLVGVCTACHAEDGNSPTPSFPKIAGLGEKYLYKQLKDVKSGERVIVEMTGLLDNLSDQNLWDMAAYFNSQTIKLSGAKAVEVLTNNGTTVDGLALGEKLYRAGNHKTQVPSCTGCHSPRGLGNGPSGVPRLSGQYAEYIEKQLRDFRAGKRVNDSGDAKIMRSTAKHMTDAEIIAVSNYIAGLN